MLRALVVSICTVIAAPAALAEQTTFFRIGTGSIGGTYFPIGGVIANAISNPPGSPACDRGGSCGVPGLIAMASASAGSVANIENMGAGVLESGLVQADIAHWAVTGTGLYEGNEEFADLRAIARLYPEIVHFVVPAESGIESVRDLEGRRVSLGELRSGTLIDSRLVLEAHGLTVDDIEAVYMHAEPASDMMVNGELDAFTIVGGAPLLAVEDIARRMPIRILSMEPEAIDALISENSFFTHESVRADIYPGVDEWESIAVSAIWVTTTDTDPDLVYGITRALWNPNTLADLVRTHPRGSDIRLESATVGLGVPLHPGAERYYREIDLLPDETPDGQDVRDDPSGGGAPLLDPPVSPPMADDGAATDRDSSNIVVPEVVQGLLELGPPQQKPVQTQ